MSLYPLNPFAGQVIQTNAAGVTCDLAFLAHLQISAANAVLGTTTACHAAIAQPASGTTVVTTAITNPGTPRNVTITGNQATCTGNVVIAGTNWNGDAITETIAASGTSTVVGAKAFKTITQITIPTQGAGGDTIAVGFGAKLGLPTKLTHNTVQAAFLNNTKEGTAPTVAVSSTALESNTFTLNSALNGSVVDVYYWT